MEATSPLIYVMIQFDMENGISFINLLFSMEAGFL